jgi:hypothetical protein
MPAYNAEQTLEKTYNEIPKDIVDKVIVVDGIDYRVPGSVIGNLKAILEKKPSLRKFSVSRQGKDKDNTKYTVIPLD